MSSGGSGAYAYMALSTSTKVLREAARWPCSKASGAPQRASTGIPFLLAASWYASKPDEATGMSAGAIAERERQPQCYRGESDAAGIPLCSDFEEVAAATIHLRGSRKQ